MTKSKLLKDNSTIESALSKIKASDKICNKCIIPDDFRGNKLSDDKSCVYCKNNSLTGKKREISEEEKKKLAKELTDKLIASKNNKNSMYDVAVGFSGGKDSTYLIWKLQKELNLNVLGIVIDHSYFPELVKQNIYNISQKLGVDFFYYNINEKFMNKYFNYKFSLFDKTKSSPVFDLICGECSNIIEGSVMKIAAQLNIPYALIGLSPEQTNRYFYRLEQSHVRETWMKDFFSQDFINDEDRKYQWDPKSESEKNLEVYLPFHVWEYNTEKIAKELAENNIMEIKNSDPLQTECKVLHTIRFLDQYNLGYDPRLGPFSDLVRLGKSDREVMIKKFYDFKFDKATIEEVHKRLNLSCKE